MNNLNKSISVISANHPQKNPNGADDYSWLVLAVPLFIYLGDKIVDFLKSAMDKNYEVDINFDKNGSFKFKMNPTDTTK